MHALQVRKLTRRALRYVLQVRLAAFRFTMTLALRHAHLLLVGGDVSGANVASTVAAAVAHAIDDAEAAYLRFVAMRRNLAITSSAVPPREGETEWSCDQIELAPIALAMWQKGDDAPVLETGRAVHQ